MGLSSVFFALLRFEIDGTELCEDIKNLIEPERLLALYQLAKKHDLAHLVGDALDKNGLFPEGSEAKKRFLQERTLAVCRYEQIRYEYEQICSVLEQARIPFIPLKGSVIRPYYPEPWMRTSCDIDILVRKEDLQEAKGTLVKRLEYATDNIITPHDISLFSPGGVHLELHYTIEGHIDEMDRVLRRVWEYSDKTEARPYLYLQDGNFLAFHIIAHMAFHFITGGCGIRPFLDLWILREKGVYDVETVRAMCAESGLTDFYEATEAVIGVWFEQKESNALTSDIENYIFEAGVYGSLENRVAVQQARSGGKIQFLCRRIFAPYSLMKVRYPILGKHKWLLPFYEIRRWLSLPFKKRSHNAFRELRWNAQMSEQKQRSVEILLNRLGLYDKE